MKKLIIIILVSVLCTSCNGYSQKIELEKTNGIYTIKCKVNTIPLTFIFDTGASHIVISSVEASFLLKNQLLKIEDIIEVGNYIDASGKVGISTKIIIREIQIGDIILNDIEAMVIEGNTVPLLFGQSAIEKLGPILLNFQEKTILILN